jgi:hypothetical protein
MSTARRVALAAACGSLLVPAAAAATENVIVYPAAGAAPKLAAVKQRSGLTVLLPDVMRLPDLTDGRRHYHFRAHSNDGAYDLSLINSACDKRLPCRRITSFSADRTDDDAPAGDLKLPRGRRGGYTLGSCTGGGCTPPSMTWIERGARYTLYAYVSKRKLVDYASQAIRGGPR